LDSPRASRRHAAGAAGRRRLIGICKSPYRTRLSRRHRGKLASLLDRIDHGYHVYRAYFKNAFLKQYEKLRPSCTTVWFSGKGKLNKYCEAMG
jgi:hypothetical protein